MNNFFYSIINAQRVNIINDAFEVSLYKGIHNNRFEITFTKSSLNIDDKVFPEFKIFQNNTISQLKFMNPNRLLIKSLSVFDVSGKQVLSDNIYMQQKGNTGILQNR